MAGRYKPYPDYKNSGDGWVGEVPTHWILCAAKRLILSSAGGTVIKGACANEQSEGLYPAFSASGQDVWLPDYKYEVPGLVLSAVGARCGKTFKADGRWGVVANTHCLIPSPQANRDYLWYLTNIENWWEIGGSAQPFVNVSLTLDKTWAFPSIAEQSKIASFLDHETAKIDTLIEKQQQLIQLLKEKRQAVISHAVTKGLNPNAKMKDSGVEWLGEVPEGWDVRRIGLLFAESSARAFSEIELEYPVLSVSIHHGISDKELNEEELDRKVTRSDDKSLYKVVHDNDLAYNMMRAWQGAFGASKLSGLVSPAYVVCKPKTSLNSFYFEMVLRTSNAVTELKKYSRGITDFRLRLYWDEFKNICVPVPPVGEVNAILNSISAISSTYDNLIVVAERQIGLLKERRTALIAAAVTGKIDVRNWQAPIDNQTNREVAA